MYSLHPLLRREYQTQEENQARSNDYDSSCRKVKNAGEKQPEETGQDAKDSGEKKHIPQTVGQLISRRRRIDDQTEYLKSPDGIKIRRNYRS